MPSMAQTKQPLASHHFPTTWLRISCETLPKREDTYSLTTVCLSIMDGMVNTLGPLRVNFTLLLDIGYVVADYAVLDIPLDTYSVLS